MNQHTIFITGGAGYVGTMLVNDFARRSDVKLVIALDREALPQFLTRDAGLSTSELAKIVWIQANTSDGSWQDRVSAYAPDTVIHTAWQIREMYGKQKEQWKWNVDGSDSVFDFVFASQSVKKLIHFSTVASYGAFPANTIEHRFTEDEPFRKTDYLYAEEKRIAEEHLKEKFDAAAPSIDSAPNRPQVFIIRPAAITGPRGRYMRIRFGLQAALSGQLKENFIHRLISAMVSFVPVTAKWARQFIHEDDIVSIVEKMTFTDTSSAGKYEVFNACPPGPVVRGKDMAQAVGKRILPMIPILVRFAFFFMWHISRGRVPTSRGGWKSYSYPIIVDGSKLTRVLGFSYTFEPKEAFVMKKGKYMQYVK